MASNVHYKAIGSSAQFIELYISEDFFLVFDLK